ncbi:RHS repeat-associated core domain-containing protein, partial [Candidatus Dependentiae bacterium]|nr:RHS repeat-associated core domain-containing protein [Candidatus Dependentiae bacterium]
KLYFAELGLYYFNARFFDPRTASFISPDPADIDLNDPFTFANPYAFCNNNPWRYTDPTGMWVNETNEKGYPQYKSRGLDIVDKAYDSILNVGGLLPGVGSTACNIASNIKSFSNNSAGRNTFEITSTGIDLAGDITEKLSLKALGKLCGAYQLYGSGKNFLEAISNYNSLIFEIARERYGGIVQPTKTYQPADIYTKAKENIVRSHNNNLYTYKKNDEILYSTYDNEVFHAQIACKIIEDVQLKLLEFFLANNDKATNDIKKYKSFDISTIKHKAVFNNFYKIFKPKLAKYSEIIFKVPDIKDSQEKYLRAEDGWNEYQIVPDN